MQTYKFRLVVRGTNAQGVRVRRVRTIDAPSYEEAWSSFAHHHAEMAEGLGGETYSVLPPVGWRVDGTLSRGFAAV